MILSILDVVVETYTPAVCTSEVSMTLRHFPTGIYVSGKDNRRQKLYDRLYQELKEKVENETHYRTG